LFVRTLNHLREQAVGFDTGHLVSFSLDPTISGYGEDRTPQIVKEALDAARRIAGVQQAAGTDDPVLTGNSNESSFVVQGHKITEGEKSNFEDPWITPDYFATLRQPLLAGREFNEGDGKSAPKVAIVNDSFAKQFYGSPQNALGRLIGEGDKPDTAIVGVVGDIRHQNLRDDIGAGVYRPYAQIEHPAGMEIYVRTAQDPATVEPAVRRAMHDLDPTLVVDDLRTMEEQVDISASDERALAMLAAGFALLAAVLAAVGLYGVLAYSTQSRTREIGVRLALGSPRSKVVSLVMREMAWIVGIALVVALPATVGAAHFFRSQLYGVSTWDPATLLAAAALTALMTVAASALPARRATGVDPMVALRSE
jgi:predicted permease